MKRSLLVVIAISFDLFALAQTQKIVSDCTVTYSVNSNDNNKIYNGATKTVYIKGVNCRSDLTSQSFSQSVIYNQNTSDAVILRTVGENKYITKLNAEQWRQQNKDFEGMKLILLTSETKTILGYECKKAIATLTNNHTYNIWYAAAIKPTVQENPYQFKDVPGFVMEYEMESGASKITYTATKINLSPLPASTFNIPTSGYKELNP